MPHSIICTNSTRICERDESEKKFSSSLQDDFPDEPCCLTHGDVWDFVDEDDQEEHPNPEAYGVMRLSEAYLFPFWTYFNRFVRYWPQKRFHVKPAYNKGFMEKKRRKTGRSLPLFESLAIEMTERHLNPSNWAAWKGGNYSDDPIWLGLYMPRLTTVDLIDVDAKQFQLGSYREAGLANSRLMPVVHLPLEHFKKLKRIYDAFPSRIWCISSETLGVHVWKKHDRLQDTLGMHDQNKKILTDIGLPSVEAHPMPGRCLRRPFGADYRTISPEGIITDWEQQLNFFENEGHPPSFRAICSSLLNAMYQQWKSWDRYGDENRKDVRKFIEQHRPEIFEVIDWLDAGCPLDDFSQKEIGPITPSPTPDPSLKLAQDVLLMTLGEKSKAEIFPIANEAEAQSISQALTTRYQSSGADLASLRNGNWAKELLRLARHGLEHEDSVGMIVHEMAKWLFWVELFHLPSGERSMEINRLLIRFILEKHNGYISRIINGQQQDVINQIARCVKSASEIAEQKSLEGFARTREKLAKGEYRFPIQLLPALTGQEDDSFSPLCQFTVMCINFDDPLLESVQQRIREKAGRTQVMGFATKLLNFLFSKGGKAFLGRKSLCQMLGYKNPNQIAKYIKILIESGIIHQGTSYSAGRNGKCYTIKENVLDEMKAADRNSVIQNEPMR